jgi:hypothetical protein
MARTLTPERKALALEAKNLREFGYTQQEVADALGVPRQTVFRWLAKVGNGHRVNVSNGGKLPRIPLTALPTIEITLYPCRYEETDGVIPDGSVDLILTDPPYLVSSNDITRSNQASLQRNFGEWDKVPEHTYQDSVKTWAVWELDKARREAAAGEELDVKAIENIVNGTCPKCQAPVHWDAALPWQLLDILDKTPCGAGYYQVTDGPPPGHLSEARKRRLNQMHLVILARSMDTPRLGATGRGKGQGYNRRGSSACPAPRGNRKDGG